MDAGERFNSISHLVGTGLAVSGSVVLIALAARLGDPWKIVSFSIYGAMLVALYLFSTMYHGARGRAKQVLRKFDHCSIYLLIAGSYTPFALVSLRGPWAGRCWAPSGASRCWAWHRKSGWPRGRACFRWRSTCSWAGWRWWRYRRCGWR